ncbi:hypothetical protein F5B20DRAFT_575596 [Whalleya microplaca]|nr:hypothetical protein F5B20DRAFT_575596 [Whalleya microplaca]
MTCIQGRESFVRIVGPYPTERDNDDMGRCVTAVPSADSFSEPSRSITSRYERGHRGRRSLWMSRSQNLGLERCITTIQNLKPAKMQFSQIFVLAVAAISTPALACKCYVNGNQDNGKTQSCCSQQGGNFVSGNDCQAASISEHLSNFRSCCGGSSDCDFPDKE